MPSLLEMTDVTMINILEKCSYKSVLALRKVCHSLRNFIDDSHFKTNLSDIDIVIDSTGFSVIFQTPEGLWTDGHSSARNWTSNDLKIILKLVQNSKLLCLTVNTTPDSVRGLDELEEILKNQTRPLQTENFEMEGSEILKVLPYLDPKTLKKIYISPAYYEAEYQILDGIEQFIELEQFKNAVELTISHVLVGADLRKFFHFQRVILNLHETLLEELVALKEAFVTSTHMEYFELNVCNVNGDQLEQGFGAPFRDDRYRLGRSQWFFGIRNCKEHVLRIETSSNLIQFWKWEAKRVPESAVVHC
ncbi:unnamed protein product [Caenorhabditis brenneri]